MRECLRVGLIFDFFDANMDISFLVMYRQILLSTPCVTNEVCGIYIPIAASIFCTVN